MMVVRVDISDTEEVLSKETLSPLLFVLAVDVLSTMLNNALRYGILNGVSFGDPRVKMCQLQFAKLAYPLPKETLHRIPPFIRLSTVALVPSPLLIWEFLFLGAYLECRIVTFF